MEDDCPLCDFILTRLDELHRNAPQEGGFSAYTLLHEGGNLEAASVVRGVTPRDLDVHMAKHLGDEVQVVPSCCTARRYRLVSAGPPPEACST
ncbi:MAG: hypothetical protein ACE5HJ_07640 [Thermoplasmata archaeon]